MGLDRVQNLSKSGLKPDYDDLGIKIKAKSNRIKIYDRILVANPVEILGNPNRIIGNPNRRGESWEIPSRNKGNQA